MSPVGSVTACRAFVLVEWPSAWPRDVSGIDALGALHAAVADSGARLQCIVPARRGRVRDDLFEVAVLRAAPAVDGWVGPYVEQSSHVAQAEIVKTALAMLGSPDLDAKSVPQRRLLICAHGRRDRCCGSAGTALALQMAEADLGAEVAVWRTSHLGGHRFAPTALMLPDATQWGLLDSVAARRIALREGRAADVDRHYRGYSGFGDAEASVIDRLALRERGWSWLDQSRRAERTGPDRWRVRAIDGTAWEASVGVRRKVPVPACGKPIHEAAKFEREYVLDQPPPVLPRSVPENVNRSAPGVRERS